LIVRFMNTIFEQDASFFCKREKEET
jgi:hypothetical protein